jgi:phenylpropionate dioxygenase-like ring-hydroxylating dioxygenase large terminal subunit
MESASSAQDALKMSEKDFWYIVAESKDLKAKNVLPVTLLTEWIALYRDETGQATAIVDRCFHRNARLSNGEVRSGELVCPYHGWRYGAKGQIMAIPSEGTRFETKANRCAKSFSCVEKEGYIYVRMNSRPADSLKSLEPFAIPFLSKPGYSHIRLKHVFNANVPNCAENFIDIPHTSFVHPNIFRYQHAPQSLLAEMEQENGNVHIRYRKETSNFGFFSKFLNSDGGEIFHEDHYFLPNVTHVEYRIGKKRHFNITSQSVPVAPGETHVYTDLTWDYGIWNFLSRPVVWWVAKKIIEQDVRIMRQQAEVIQKYGETFASTKSDLQHVWIEKIYSELLAGRDPRLLPAKKETVEFWI